MQEAYGPGSGEAAGLSLLWRWTAKSNPSAVSWHPYILWRHSRAHRKGPSAPSPVGAGDRLDRRMRRAITARKQAHRKGAE